MQTIAASRNAQPSIPSLTSPTVVADPTTAARVASGPSTGVDAGPVVVTAVSVRTPQGAAVAWFTALRTASFRDSPSSWVDRIAPYSTPALQASYRTLASAGTGGGAGWTAFVRNGCVAALVNTAGVIPPEAPVAAEQAHVQVSATLTTVCRTGKPKASTEFIAATVLVTKQHGRWAVAKREF